MGSVLETEHLKVVFKGAGRRKDVVAVDDLTLSVNEGEVVGFIGPNGAGKTTTIKVLMGFIFPTSGDARVLGYEAGSKLARSRTGYLPEVALYYPFMTAEEILRLYGRLQGIRRTELRDLVSDLISRVGLEKFGGVRLRNFSKGMLQRVGLAQAIMGNPDLLILDEVTSGLDPVGRRDLRNILKDFKSRGKTIFFSSHSGNRRKGWLARRLFRGGRRAQNHIDKGWAWIASRNAPDSLDIITEVTLCKP